ncbi:MAG: Gfo/Idh/MocA family oxidoreductase [Planctomycetia bacterium]|nr:Gfo/Idh/MocA family oxidoreductase [Planctomycetia bacterium]
MSNWTRRSFLNTGVLGTLGTTLAANLMAQEKPNVQGFDQTETEIDNTKEWKPVCDRKIKVGIAGFGACQFGAQFGFQNHPNVEVVAVTDLIPERCAGLAKACRCENTYESLEEMIKNDDIEAVFVATDAPHHADHCTAVVHSGKHVACAVPAFWGGTPEQADMLYEAVKKSGMVYGMFETSAFHDDVYACRKIYKAGGFGEMVYTEGEYLHYAPVSTPSYKNWRVGMPVMWYPTHATAYYTCVTGNSFTEVSAMGKPSINKFRQPENNAYGNCYGTEVGLFRTSEGGMARMIVSFDTPGWGGEVGRNRGQLASYGEQSKYHSATAEAQAIYDKLNLLKPALPASVDSGGHGGSHGHLMNNFVEAILKEELPVVNIAVALNTTVCGVVAHQSVLKDGELLKIPQYKL